MNADEYKINVMLARGYIVEHLSGCCQEVKDWSKHKGEMPMHIQYLCEILRPENPSTATMQARTLIEAEAVRVVAEWQR